MGLCKLSDFRQLPALKLFLADCQRFSKVPPGRNTVRFLLRIYFSGLLVAFQTPCVVTYLLPLPEHKHLFGTMACNACGHSDNFQRKVVLASSYFQELSWKSTPPLASVPPGVSKPNRTLGQSSNLRVQLGKPSQLRVSLRMFTKVTAELSRTHQTKHGQGKI